MYINMKNEKFIEDCKNKINIAIDELINNLEKDPTYQEKGDIFSMKTIVIFTLKSNKVTPSIFTKIVSNVGS